ncbi:Response regulator receiver domain-containing protein [Filimonas lacunae]|uniref:Response regulator receiver domain-containing protein n=1 Tax=Filimonas lacunae TaxID=477680 RepID=A0A173MIN4_9BACT|nr:response regulator [Filimonas lacunae]BAV07502.1 receiver component of a two-component response regulator [Filimonas lacunae]SIT30159.1 Response regulator receiver domain-containing protein [Filimonas lacunae]
MDTLPATRKRILIIEDDGDECDLMAQHFSPYFDITGFADNYDKLIGLLQPNHLPQIILTNLNLPRKNGLEILQELKGNKAYQQIPVIIMSVSFPDFLKIQAMQLGASACVDKPELYNHYETFCKNIYQLTLQ